MCVYIFLVIKALCSLPHTSTYVFFNHQYNAEVLLKDSCDSKITKAEFGLLKYRITKPSTNLLPYESWGRTSHSFPAFRVTVRKRSLGWKGGWSNEKGAPVRSLWQSEVIYWTVFFFFGRIYSSVQSMIFLKGIFWLSAGIEFLMFCRDLGSV